MKKVISFSRGTILKELSGLKFYSINSCVRLNKKNLIKCKRCIALCFFYIIGSYSKLREASVHVCFIKKLLSNIHIIHSKAPVLTSLFD